MALHSTPSRKDQGPQCISNKSTDVQHPSQCVRLPAKAFPLPLCSCPSLCLPLSLPSRYDPEEFETTEFAGDFAEGHSRAKWPTPPHVLARSRCSSFSRQRFCLYPSQLQRPWERSRQWLSSAQTDPALTGTPMSDWSSWSSQILVTHHCCSRSALHVLQVDHAASCDLYL